MSKTNRLRKANSRLAAQIFRETQHCATKLTESGLMDAINFLSLSAMPNDEWVINLPGADYSRLLKNRPYKEIYEIAREEGAYCYLLPDGALVQLYYQGRGEKLLRSRIACLPSPSLEPFQHDPDLYLRDVQFIDIVGHQVVPVPIRFDYDDRDGVPVDVSHPVSHLTLGQYQHCRIPVTHPVSPSRFLDFLIRNFYSTPEFVTLEFKNFSGLLTETITPNELNLSHFRAY